MAASETWKRLLTTMRDVFEQPNLEVDENTTADDIIGWDSMGHVRLILALEEEFDIEFEPDDIVELRDVGELRDTITEQVKS